MKVCAYVLQMKLDPHLEDARRRFWRLAHALETDAPELAEIRNLEVGGGDGLLPARLYTPFAAGVAGPALIYFHGGAFVIGDLDSHDLLCRRLAHSAGHRVLSVAYRLAPEHRFPAAAEDAIASTLWAAEQAQALGFDAARLSVGGDSAGGNLAAVASQQVRKHGLKLATQVLIYPSTQWVTMTPSQVRLKQGHVLTGAVQDFFRDKYLRTEEDRYDVRASPLLENDLAGLAPAYVVTAGLDPLRDEGRAYADKLAAFGVPVTHREFPDQPHGFFSMTGVSPTAKRAIEACGDWLKAAA